MDGQAGWILGLLALMTGGGLLAALWRKTNHGAFLGEVRRELKKERSWLRRGEYNAAMVKGRQNLELLLKSVAYGPVPGRTEGGWRRLEKQKTERTPQAEKAVQPADDEPAVLPLAR